MTCVKKDTRPNIILITTDQQRADALGCEGHPILLTPHIDLLAFQGTRFTRCYSDCPICIPARATIMNGKHAWAYGDPTYFDRKPMPIDNHLSLPGLLHDVGYKTQAIGKMHFWPQRCCYGFDNMILTELDYQDYLLGTPYAGRAMGHGLGNNEVYPMRAMAPQEFSPTTWTVDETIKYLDKRDPTSPFFLWVSFTKPHPPFDPPAPYDTMYDPDDCPDPVIADWADNDCPNPIYKKRVSYKHDIIPPEVVRKAASHYYGLITEVDYQIGRLIGALRERELLDNSLLCFTSDHGESLGDQRCFGKTTFYEGSARVPFILRLPMDHPDFNPGQTCDAPVSLADILPTFAEFAGAGSPDDISGKSLLPLMAGANAVEDREYLCCQCYDQYMLTDGEEKYIWYKWGGKEQLFNLRSDPREKHNIIHGPIAQPTVQKWRDRLMTWLREMGDDGTDGERLVAKTAPMPPDNVLRAKNSLGLIERMRTPYDHNGRAWLVH